mgnify:CR=1 FL=1
MVNVVTAYEDIEKLEPIIKVLKNDIPEVTTIINNINTKKADVSYGEYEILLHGNRTIEEKINGLTFDISANSFFQTNTLQGEKLYDEVKKLCNLKGNEIIYDLYCGTGTIGLSLSQTSKHVYGFEIIRSSLENAQINAIKNNVKNITFKFPETEFSGFHENLKYGARRAKLAWYTIDPLFFRNTSITPPNVNKIVSLDNGSSIAQQSYHYVREVFINEVFPNKDQQTGQPSRLRTLDIAFYPNERGPYNFDVAPSEHSSGIDENGYLNDPETRWGGITLSLIHI